MPSRWSSPPAQARGFSRSRSENLPELSRAAASVPTACNPGNRTAHKEIGHESKHDGDDDCLGRIEPLQHHDLVNHIHHKPEEEDPGCCIQTFSQPAGTLARFTHD